MTTSVKYFLRCLHFLHMYTYKILNRKLIFHLTRSFVHFFSQIMNQTELKVENDQRKTPFLFLSNKLVCQYTFQIF